MTSPSSTQGDQRGELAHPVLAHQRPAAGLVASERAQVALDARRAGSRAVDDLQRHGDPLARVDGQLAGRRGTARPASVRSSSGAPGDAMVIQRRADPLGPAGPLSRQRVAQPGARAPLAHMLGRNHASGSRPSHNSCRSHFASARSVFARRLRPRSALVSTGSARCATAPQRSSARQTNSQPVHASTATWTSRPGNRVHPLPRPPPAWTQSARATPRQSRYPARRT